MVSRPVRRPPLLAANPQTGVVIVIHANVQEISLHDLVTLAGRLDRLTRAAS